MLTPCGAHAQVVITEIMYDLAEGSDSGREWIELFNAGEPVDLTKLKVIENGSNHTISAVGERIVPPGAYVVIADNPEKFKGDNPGYAGPLFDSAFSLNNDGETISLADASGAMLDSVAYTDASANSTGDSLQRNPGSNQFDAGIPTPGTPIPVGGLAKSPPKAGKSAKKAASPTLGATSLPAIVGNPPSLPNTRLTASAAASGTPPALWWAGPFMLSLVASAGLALSRHCKKDEWDIVEEIEETS